MLENFYKVDLPLEQSAEVHFGSISKALFENSSAKSYYPSACSDYAI